jgi:hypothetical protein
VRAKRSENLSFVVVEIAILDSTTCDKDDIYGLGKIMSMRTKDVAEPALNLIPERCSLLYLRCYSYG